MIRRRFAALFGKMWTVAHRLRSISQKICDGFYSSIARAKSLRDALRARRERTRRSIETDGSPASILATRDWLDRRCAANCSWVSPWRLRRSFKNSLKASLNSINRFSPGVNLKNSRAELTFQPLASKRLFLVLFILLIHPDPSCTDPLSDRTCSQYARSLVSVRTIYFKKIGPSRILGRLVGATSGRVLARLGCNPRNMRTKHWERKIEAFHLHFLESAHFNRSPSFTVGMTIVGKKPHHRPNQCLDSAMPRSSRSGHVFDKNKSSSGLQNTQHFPQRGGNIANGAKHQSRHRDVNALILHLHFFCSATTQIHTETQALRFSLEIRIHERIRLHSSPDDAPWKELEIRSCAGTDFQNPPLYF